MQPVLASASYIQDQTGCVTVGDAVRCPGGQSQMNNSESIKRARGTRWCVIGIWLTGTGIALLIISLAGGRLELLSPIAAFMLFGIACLVLVVSALTTGIGIAISLGTAGDASAARSWGALAISVILFGTVLSQRPHMSGVPPIHDITTDTTNPPQFEAILPLRADAPNPPDYAGAEIARQQLAAYPDLVTLTINLTTDEAFTAAEQIAYDLGWEIVAADRTAGRIEAVATTTWFRFKDDIVIRLTPNNSETNVDARSKSRVGQSDMGANAARLRAFFSQLEAAD